MKTVQVIEETDMSRQYDASFYTHGDGLYLWSCDNQLIVVENGTVLCLGYVNAWRNFMSSGSQVSAQGETISADTLLKAIAITQQPELIKEI